MIAYCCKVAFARHSNVTFGLLSGAAHEHRHTRFYRDHHRTERIRRAADSARLRSGGSALAPQGLRRGHALLRHGARLQRQRAEARRGLFGHAREGVHRHQDHGHHARCVLERPRGIAGQPAHRLHRRVPAAQHPAALPAGRRHRALRVHARGEGARHDSPHRRDRAQDPCRRAGRGVGPVRDDAVPVQLPLLAARARARGVLRQAQRGLRRDEGTRRRPALEQPRVHGVHERASHGAAHLGRPARKRVGRVALLHGGHARHGR